MDPRDNLFRWQYFCHIPTIRATNVHKFDEAQNNTAALEMVCHWHDLVIVRSFFHHNIDFDVLKASVLRGSNVIQNIGHRKSTSFILRKMSSFKPSRLTVSLCNPAAFKETAFLRKMLPPASKRLDLPITPLEVKLDYDS